MIHARQDYNRFQDPNNIIPEDEPVMLFRGQDKLVPDLLRLYAERTRLIGGSEELAKKIEDHADLMDKWQSEVKVKVADLP